VCLCVGFEARISPKFDCMRMCDVSVLVARVCRVFVCVCMYVVLHVMLVCVCVCVWVCMNVCMF